MKDKYGENQEWEENRRRKEDADPGAVQQTKVIFVPKVQSMDEYLKLHYKDYIIQELNKRLVDGELSQVLKETVVSEHIVPDECLFRGFSYWRLNQCDFLIDVELRLELRTQTPAGIDTDFFCVYVELWFSFYDEDGACEFMRVGLLDDIPSHENCWKLDKYLVPILRRDEIEDYAEEVWTLRYPEAAKDQRLRDARALTGRLHLSVITRPLYKHGDTKGIIFFHEGTILVKPSQLPGEKDDPPPVKEQVPANTIVINKRAEGGSCWDLAVFHECIHYEWHYLFYRLQNMHNTDVSQLKKEQRIVVRDNNAGDPVHFMEYQARYGSYGLMMPRTFMLEKVDSLYQVAYGNKRRDGYYDHDGRRYECVARRIADEYTISKACVRARLIQLGYNAAIGSLNYVDGHYIVPFALSDTSSCSGDETYVIDRKSVAELYLTDDAFRKIMQTGMFAYVDGHVVYCEHDNVVNTMYGARLSGWANAHIDCVSLRFKKTYEGDHNYTYTFGEMNNKEAVDSNFRFLDLSSSMSVKDKQKVADRLIEEMPLSFHSALSFIMKGRCTVDELISRIPISRSTLLRLRTEERKQYDLDQIVAICVGLHLPPWLSRILLERAHLNVERYGPLAHYGMILDCFYMDSIEDVQAFMKENNYDPLKLNFETV